MDPENLNLTVETPAVAPAISTPLPEVPATPVTPAAEPKADKQPTLRESLESSLKAIRDRPRDEAGRFVPPAKQPDATAAAPKDIPKAPAVAAAELPKPAKIERPGDMPKAWGADKAPLWQALTPEQRAVITERETQMEGFHSKFGGLKPYAEAAAANGTSLPEVLERVSRVEDSMLADPSQGLIMACQMVGLDQQSAVAALAGALRALGVQVGPAQGQQPTAPGVPPQGQQPTGGDARVEVLMRELQTLKSGFQQQAVSEAQAKVNAFFADPANEHANDLANEISAELKAMQAMGLPPDLPKAYERAMWTRPDLREKLVAKQVAAKAEEAAKARTQELERSRSAQRSVAGSPPAAEGRSGADKPASLRDDLTHKVRALMSGRV